MTERSSSGGGEEDEWVEAWLQTADVRGRGKLGGVCTGLREEVCMHGLSIGVSVNFGEQPEGQECSSVGDGVVRRREVAGESNGTGSLDGGEILIGC